MLVHGYTDTARDWLMLVRWGAKDAIIDDAQKDALRTALPKAQVKIYPEFGHNPIWEDPADVANTIKGFLAN